MTSHLQYNNCIFFSSLMCVRVSPFHWKHHFNAPHLLLAPSVVPALQDSSFPLKQTNALSVTVIQMEPLHATNQDSAYVDQGYKAIDVTPALKVMWVPASSPINHASNVSVTDLLLVGVKWMKVGTRLK